MSNEDKDPQYFNYYAQLQHQQNMLQDSVRTGTYRTAILMNGPNGFKNKLVLDVGAGSGILSYFAIQAGATHVYAVEASNMADKMKKLIYSSSTDRNNYLKDKISIINAKIEQSNLDIPMVDTIVSEPIGVLLFHERMLESYIYARDHYLKPGGTLFPSKGIIHLAPFTDSRLWKETKSNATFWEQNSFYDIDLSALYKDACEELFGMPVIGQFDHRNIITTDNNEFNINFNTVSIDELQDMVIPFSWTSSRTGMMNGIAGWFDIVFEPPGGTTIAMSTGPHTDATHWYQTRFLFSDPLPVKAHQTIQGWMRCVVNKSRSYTIYIEVVVGLKGDMALSDPNLVLEDVGLFIADKSSDSRGRRGKWELQEQTYNNSYIPPS